MIQPSIARKVLSEFSRLAPRAQASNTDESEMLTERERDILSLLVQGLTNHQIAEKLHLAEGTVKNYISGIFQKLGVQDRTQAALRAKELGWV